MAQANRPDFSLTASTDGSQLARHIRTVLKIIDDEARIALVGSAITQVKKLLGINDDLVMSMADIQIADVIAYQKDDLPDQHEVIWEDAMLYEYPSQDTEFLEINNVLKHIANACMTTGNSGLQRVLAKLNELADHLELFVAVHARSTKHIGNTDMQLNDLAEMIRSRATELSEILYEELKRARQAKTALTTRSSRIKKILNNVEHSQDFKTIERLFNTPIGARQDTINLWLIEVFEEFKRLRPELERFFTSYQKEWYAFAASAFGELVTIESDVSYAENKIRQHLAWFKKMEKDLEEVRVRLETKMKSPVIVPSVHKESLNITSGVKLTFAVDKDGFHSIFHLPAKYKNLHFAATIHVTLQLNVKFKDKQVFTIDGTDPDESKIIVSTKNISSEDEFTEIQNVLFISLANFLEEKSE